MIKAGVINPDKFACLTLQGPASIASMRQWTLKKAETSLQDMHGGGMSGADY